MSVVNNSKSSEIEVIEKIITVRLGDEKTETFVLLTKLSIR